MKYPKLRELKEAIKALITGPYTTKYPFEPHVPFPKFRGKPEPSNDGCVGCGACAQACPAEAIKIEEKGGKRTLTWRYDICIFCGQCQAVCITGRGVKLGQEFDLAVVDRTHARSGVEKELVFCQKCGEAVTTREHLRWIYDRLGAKAFANPTLILSATQPETAGKQPEKDYIQRQDLIQILGPHCRHEVLIKDLLGK